MGTELTSQCALGLIFSVWIELTVHCAVGLNGCFLETQMIVLCWAAHWEPSPRYIVLLGCSVGTELTVQWAVELLFGD